MPKAQKAATSDDRVSATYRRLRELIVGGRLGAGGPRLLALHHGIKPQAERYVRVYVNALMDEIATSVAEHNVIIRAIESGNPDAAQRAVQTNWRNAADRLGRVITNMGEHGTW